MIKGLKVFTTKYYTTSNGGIYDEFSKAKQAQKELNRIIKMRNSSSHKHRWIEIREDIGHHDMIKTGKFYCKSCGVNR